MTLSSNSFDKDFPAQTGTFANADPAQGGSFANADPAQGGSFANAAMTQGSSPAKDEPEESNVSFDGDNTSGGVYGGDFASFGDIYGQGVYGGQTHFKNRSDLPEISH